MNALQMNGLDLFVKYAFPSNRLGYCGPQKSDLFFEIFMEIKQKREKGVEVGEKLLKELKQLSEQFEAAIPYLKIIAKSNNINDFFDKRVVEAYWLGNDLLCNVDFAVLHKDLKARYADIFLYENRQILSGAKDIIRRVKPVHIFHVLNIYAQAEFTLKNYKTILQVIDNCRVRTGTVLNVFEDEKLKDLQAIVEVRHNFLEFDDYGNLMIENETVKKFFTMEKDLKAGDVVSLRYDYVCDKLTENQKENLDKWTEYHIEIFNGCRDNIF